MSRRLRQLSGRRLPDPQAEESRREQHEAIVELQRIASRVGVVLPNVALEDGIETPIAHGLGRAPRIIKPGILRGAASAGYINEIRRDAELVVLRADGYGATIRVDLECS